MGGFLKPALNFRYIGFRSYNRQTKAGPLQAKCRHIADLLWSYSLQTLLDLGRILYLAVPEE
jgi:hypothetical protein